MIRSKGAITYKGLQDAAATALNYSYLLQVSPLLKSQPCILSTMFRLLHLGRKYLLIVWAILVGTTGYVLFTAFIGPATLQQEELPEALSLPIDSKLCIIEAT